MIGSVIVGILYLKGWRESLQLLKVICNLLYNTINFILFVHILHIAYSGLKSIIWIEISTVFILRNLIINVNTQGT